MPPLTGPWPSALDQSDAPIPLHDRHLPLRGTRNLRDVGGYPAGEGRRVRWRTLFRTDSLDRLAPAAQARLLDLGVRQVIDLRFPNEQDESPSVFRDSDRVRYRSIPLLPDDPPPPDGIAANYRRVIDRRGRQLVEVARAVLEPGCLPAVIGCAAGIDRTGVAIAILLSAVGVPAAVIATDYGLSAAHFSGDASGTGLDDWRGGSVTVDCLPEYMLGALDHLDRRHGGAGRLLMDHGLTKCDVARLREILTEPSSGPGAITG
jgi:protein-tyrosine phosphatase